MTNRPQVRVYEPALCCNTGVCGPDLDATLVTFTADLEALQQAGADIQRFNLANDPSAFAASETVKNYLLVAGSAGLPLTVVDEVTVGTGTYLPRERLAELAGVQLSAENGSCCGGAPAPTPTPQPRQDLGLQHVENTDEGCCGGQSC